MATQSFSRTHALRAVSARGVAARFPTSYRSVRKTCTPAPKLGSGSRTSDRFVLRAQANDELDFDKFLIILAKKWEEADNKGIVVGYSAAAVLTFAFTEWFIHLPVLDVILGFPIQLVGVLVSPYLIARWFLEKKDWFDDVSAATGTVVDQLPGLKKGGDTGSAETSGSTSE